MASEVRAPRLRVTLDGSELAGVIGADIFANNHFGADRFRVRLAASATPEDSLQVPGARLEISVTLDGDWTSVLVGLADCVSLDAIHGVMDVEGRDLSSMLIEARVDETFANRTASEVAQTFASRHGLQADVEQTTTPIGRYYQAEHDVLTLGQFAKATTEWDLLAVLAGLEGFDLFMTGATLCFGPSSSDGVFVLRKENCITLQLEHSLTLARQIEVTVRSWGTRSGTSVTETASAGNGGTTLKHSITRPNLTADEAQLLANRTLADLVRHEWTATATMPGELELNSRSRVSVSGTGTVWDRDYKVSQLTRNLDVRRGFTQRISLQGAG